MGDKPAFKIRDGLITVTAWANTNDKGTIYNVDAPVRSYKTDNGEWKETSSLTGGEVLRAANLLTTAHNKILDLVADAKS